MVQTVSTSASPSSLSKLASGPTGRRLRASVLPWSDVFRYSIEYWYWLSIKAHRASLLAARAGVGPNRAVSGLWSVTRMNVRPYKNWWNLLRAKIMASASGGSRISGRGGLITIFTSGGGYWRGRAPPVTARGSGGAL